MNFSFTDEQVAMRDVARDLFERESPPARIRSLWDGAPRDGKLWRTMSEIGITGLDEPLDAALVLEEAGRAALPEPLVEAFAAGGSDDPVAIVDAGTALDADETRRVLAVRDGVVHELDRFDATRVPSIDPSRRVFAVSWSEGRPTDVSALLERAAWATACVLNGVCLRLVEMTVAYVKEREQFGRPVGSFQAVKHKLADAWVATESSRACAWHAAWTMSRDDMRAAAVAKAYAGETADLVNRHALQCHGGIGFTWEHDLHIWLKRGLALRSAYGSAREHRRTIARRIIDGSS